MRIASLRTVEGPNRFHSRPVLVMTLDLGAWAERASDGLPGFNARLAGLLPGLGEHACSPGVPGGFLERLARGTYPAHVIEHIALELSRLAGIGVRFGKTVFAGREGRYDIATTYRSETGMRSCLESAVAVFLAVAGSAAIDLDGLVRAAREAARTDELGPSGRALWDAAQSRGIPCRRIGRASLLELGHGFKRKRLQTAVSDETSLIGAELAQDKALTKEVLRGALIPVPEGFVARGEEELAAGLAGLDPPWVIKPLDGRHGRGVSLGLRTLEDARRAFVKARAFGGACVVETMIAGRDYRLLVVGGRFAAAAERSPAHVVGDGVSTVARLIETANADPRRGDGHDDVLTRIAVDEDARGELRAQGLGIDSVPEPGRRVRLRGTANLSTGGTAADVTTAAHPEIRALAERAARWVGLDICGIDLIHSDIRRAPDAATAVIEVNAGPGLRMHVAPSEGRPVDVAGGIIDALFPGDDGRIPIVSVTGTNGKTTVARLAAHMFSAAGYRVGQTTSDGLFIGGRLAARGDAAGPRSARAVLHDPSVEIAVLETARGGIARAGLGYDWSDVGIVTNVRPDHFGQDGIESIEDLLRLKALVAERVRAGGTLVLNADDEASASMAGRPAVARVPKTYVYHSLDPGHPVLSRHLAAGGAGYFVRDGSLLESVSGRETPIAAINELPFAFGGTFGFQVSNALAAVAAARALGLSAPIVRRALADFRATELNVGRVCVYRVRGARVVLDYGHNAAAIGAISSAARRWEPRRLIGVLGLPGDRSDALLEDAARVAARAFDALVLREDRDRRGRSPGEVPALIERAARECRPDIALRVRPEAALAMRETFDALEDGDVAIVFYEEIDEALAVLRDYDPRPVAGAAVTGAEERIPEHDVPFFESQEGHESKFGPPPSFASPAVR